MREKSPLQSKKFWAYLVSEVGFFILMGMFILRADLNTIGANLAFQILSVTAGFVAVGYILGQSYVDRYLNAVKTTLGKDHDDKD